jgi:hypothetical protein
MNIKNIRTVVHTGDNNQWCWEKWNKRHQKYWQPENIPVTFLSENKIVNFKNIESVQTGNVSWAEGLITYLKSIQEDFIIYLHEDYYLTNYVDFSTIDSLLSLISNINIIKCCGPDGGYPLSKLSKSNIKFNNIYLWKYDDDNDYLISHQPSIWRKDFLLSTLNQNISPWQHEIIGTNLLKNKNNKIYVYKGNKEFPYTEPIPYVEVGLKGKVRPKWKHFFYEEI